MLAQQLGETAVAEAEAMLAAGLVEETVGAQVEGPARLQGDLDVLVLPWRLSPRARRPPLNSRTSSPSQANREIFAPAKCSRRRSWSMRTKPASMLVARPGSVAPG
jgi:hypothetical protein